MVRAVHERMRHRHAARRGLVADRFHQEIGLQLRLGDGVMRRKLDYAEHGAVVGRGNVDRLLGRVVLRERERRRVAIGDPQVG